MNIMKKENMIFTNDTCCECNGRKDVKILEINGSFHELCKKCRETLIHDIKREENLSKEELIKAIKILKENCEKFDDCNDCSKCVFWQEGCMVSDCLPSEWDLKKMI